MISDRVRQIREAQNAEGKKMTQEAFGEQLGVSRSVIANLEYGRVEPTEAIIKLICATFNVNYSWLKGGIGEMFISTDDSVANRIDDLLAGENETAKALFRAFASLDDSDWLTVQKVIDELKKN
ncbi:MAG: helix-turn-helix transcriptional regulator [Clostridiales bacterium]|nr:helix-turn-helix transcriptional regulator [Clostridiales bacterium]